MGDEMKKRLLSMLLVLCMIMTTMPVFAVTQSAYAAGISDETTALDAPAASEGPADGGAPADETPASAGGETTGGGSEAEPAGDAKGHPAPLGTAAPVATMPIEVRYVQTVNELQWYIDNTNSDLFVSLGGGFEGYYEAERLIEIPASNPYDITIDLNGYKLWGKKTERSGSTVVNVGSNAIEHNGSGTLTIMDSKGSGGVQADDVFIAVVNKGAGSVCIKGGTIKGGAFGEAVFNRSQGTVSISGGTVCSESGIAVFNENGAGKVIVSGSPTISGGNGAIRVGGDAADTVLEITGGTIESPGIAINNLGSGKIAIPSGTAVIRGKYSAMNTAPELGEALMVTASADYSGSPAAAYDSASIGNYKYLRFEPAAAQIGSTRYASLQAALDAAGQNGTVQLVQDITENVTIPSGNTNSITLDLNGRTLSGDSDTPAITHQGSGELKVFGGTVESASSKNGAILSEGGGTVNITAATVKNTGAGYAIASDAGLVNIGEDAKIISACSRVDRGTIWLYGGVSGREDTVVLNLTGGEIENTAETGFAINKAGVGKICVPRGIVFIRSRDIAMNVAPDTTGYYRVKVTASANYDGSDPAEYDKNAILSYRYIVFEQGFAAQIGNKVYVNLAGAVSAAKDGQTITLLDNTVEAVTIPKTNANSFTIDLNGKSWVYYVSSALRHEGSGTLTVIDSAGGGRIAGSTGAVVLDGGSFVLKSGTVEVPDSSTNTTIKNLGTGSLTVLGGTVKGSIGAIYNYSTGKITIGGTAYITSTVVDKRFGTSSTIVLDAGSSSQTILEISGGTIENTGDVVANRDSYAVQNNGKGKIFIPDGTTAVIRSRYKAMSQAPDLSGYPRAQVTASANFDGSGAVSYNPSNIGSYRYIKVMPRDDAAVIGKYGYTTLQAAVDSVKSGQTIKLIKNTSANATVNAGFDFTLDLNGKTLKANGSGAVITKSGSGTLTVTDTAGGGKITSENSATINVMAGTFAVSGGKVENREVFTGAAVRNNGSGSVSVSGGSVEGYYVAIHNMAGGSVNVSGGEVRNTGNGCAIANSMAGKITVSGSAKITGSTSKSGDGAILLLSGSASDTVLEIRGGTIENAKGIAVNNNGSGKIAVSGGKSVIKGNTRAMTQAPDLSGFEKVQVTASAKYDGGSPAAEYSPDSISSYKHLTFEASPDTTVSELDLVSKLAAPAAGKTPVTAINSASQYTGTVKWSGNPAKFGADTAYTATVTLKANDGFTFSGLAENAFAHEGADSVSHARGYGRTLTITVVFPAASSVVSVVYNAASEADATIWLRGSGLAAVDRLVTKTLSSGRDYETMLRLAAENDAFGEHEILGIYDISLESGVKSTGSGMYLTFAVSEQYAGEMLTLAHIKADGTVEFFYANVDEKGLVEFGPLYELSPFMLVRGLLPEERMDVDAMHTQAGGIFQIYIWGINAWWFIGTGIVLAAAAVLAVILVRRRKRNR